MSEYRYSYRYSIGVVSEPELRVYVITHNNMLWAISFSEPQMDSRILFTNQEERYFQSCVVDRRILSMFRDNQINTSNDFTTGCYRTSTKNYSFIYSNSSICRAYSHDCAYMAEYTSESKKPN